MKPPNARHRLALILADWANHQREGERDMDALLSLLAPEIRTLDAASQVYGAWLIANLVGEGEERAEAWEGLKSALVGLAGAVRALPGATRPYPAEVKGR